MLKQAKTYQDISKTFYRTEEIIGKQKKISLKMYFSEEITRKCKKIFFKCIFNAKK